ncbi:MAG: hypothetical protein Q7T76_21685 [Ferruginibacter sp.]|nr:hypothetical protein [Ferruginibacter sp.]
MQSYHHHELHSIEKAQEKVLIWIKKNIKETCGDRRIVRGVGKRGDNVK